MISAMLVLPELYGHILARFHEIVLDRRSPIRQQLQALLRRGGIPRAEVVIYQNEIIN